MYASIIYKFRPVCFLRLNVNFSLPGMSTATSDAYPAGTAPVKAEYVFTHICPRLHGLSRIDICTFRYLVSPDAARLAPKADDDAAEGSTRHTVRSADGLDGNDDGNEDGEPPAKKQKLTNSQKRKLSKEEKKANRGMNKGRRWQKTKDDVDVCWRVATGGDCEFGAEYVLHLSLFRTS